MSGWDQRYDIDTQQDDESSDGQRVSDPPSHAFYILIASLMALTLVIAFIATKEDVEPTAQAAIRVTSPSVVTTTQPTTVPLPDIDDQPIEPRGVPQGIPRNALDVVAEIQSDESPVVRGDPFVASDTLPLPPKPPSGVNGLPFAPDGLSLCDEMMFYARQFGITDILGEHDTYRVGFGESSCKNYVKTWCCYGHWQLYVTLHLKDHRLGPRYAECGISSIADVFGDTPIQKQRNACGARAVLDVQGPNAWDAY